MTCTATTPLEIDTSQLTERGAPVEIPESPPVVVQADLAEIQGWLDRAQADEFFMGYVREMSSLPPRRPWWRRLNDWLRGRS